MKKQTIKKRTKKFEESEDIINKKKTKIVIGKNNYGITLIALVITVIVLLILARYQYFDVKSEITIF